MATSVEMPKPGNTVEECELTAWLKHKGDPVASGDVIAEVETDKASFEVTAPADGIMLEAFFDEGALVPVYTPICVIGGPGESAESFRPLGGVGAAARGAAPAGRAGSAPDIAATPSPAGLARAPGPADPGAPDPSGITGQPGTPGRRQPGAPAAVPNGSAAAALAAFSPRARRFARDHDVRARPATGSGPRGRVIESDLRTLPSVVPRSFAVPRAPAAAISPVRQRLARGERESLSRTAQYTLNGSANAGGLLAVRRVMKASPATAAITISDLVACCVIRALRQAPGLNAELAGGLLQWHTHVHLGFACDTDQGLMVPVIRDSQRLSLAQLSLRRRELAAAAAAGTIAPADLAGGTFTVINLGRLGVESFTPVLSPPQVAILGVNAIAVKPVRKPDGNIEFIDSIGLSLTLDHDVIDGAPGARLLNVLARAIWNAESLCAS